MDCACEGSRLRAPYENHPETSPPTPHPHPWKRCLPQNQSLVPKRLRTAALKHHMPELDAARALSVLRPSSVTLHLSLGELHEFKPQLPLLGKGATVSSDTCVRRARTDALPDTPGSPWPSQAPTARPLRSPETLAGRPAMPGGRGCEGGEALDPRTWA